MTERKPELAGQAVVVIGGSAGIGLETARHARAAGAEVILTGRNRDRLSQAGHDVAARETAAFVRCVRRAAPVRGSPRA